MTLASGGAGAFLDVGDGQDLERLGAVPGLRDADAEQVGAGERAQLGGGEFVAQAQDHEAVGHRQGLHLGAGGAECQVAQALLLGKAGGRDQFDRGRAVARRQRRDVVLERGADVGIGVGAGGRRQQQHRRQDEGGPSAGGSAGGAWHAANMARRRGRW